MVYALAASLVQPADVDDVVQNAFLRAFRNLDMLADPAKFGVWLRRIAFGASIDHVRAERSRGDRSYADILHEGPVPRASDSAAWRETRARFLAEGGYGTYAEALRTYERWDASLAAFADYDEVVLWFEHDLFDQLLLLRHLDWFSRRDLGTTTLSLICIGEFPGFDDFHGLGELDADQLASLLGTRQRVSAGQLALGGRGWQAFTASDPSELVAMAREATTELPFLPGALERFLEEYPAVGTGLPRTERHILELLAHRARSPRDLFRDQQGCEERVFMGDSTFHHRLRSLAAGPTPLVRLDVDSMAGPDLPRGMVHITDAGRDVLAGRADWVRLAGFDRWLGGVHLRAPLGGDVAWRWDRTRRRLDSGLV